MKEDEIVIVANKRTPIGNFVGQLSHLSAIDLGAHALHACTLQADIDPNLIDEVQMGCVLPAGLGQAPARQAAIQAGCPNSTRAVTVNKVCGSGIQSVIHAYHSLSLGVTDFVLAGGMESMSNAPYLLDKHRVGHRFGHQLLRDSLFVDGLEDAYETGHLMGVFAERTATHYEFTRAAQDDYARVSLQRALSAHANHLLIDEISSIESIANDEGPKPQNIHKISELKPVFDENGTITAANASSISDGAAALLLTSLTQANQHDIRPIARIKGYRITADAPEWFTRAPVKAIRELCEQIGWSLDRVDLFEVNEAFAVVPMLCMQELNLDSNRVNVHGGACAIGHPLGASGARILVTLINALIKRKKQRGIAAICIGGGEAIAIAIEMI